MNEIQNKAQMKFKIKLKLNSNKTQMKFKIKLKWNSRRKIGSKEILKHNFNSKGEDIYITIYIYPKYTFIFL